MLEKERFLAIKKLARDIRKDNKDFFKKLEKKSAETSVKEKEKFIESTINDMSIAFSDGEQGREEKQIFRANILIPDDDEFYSSYSKDKNIRSLMKKYAVNIEDVMSKITELNIYGKYIDEQDDSDFVDEMVKISPKEAENLLDEIDTLSNTLTNLDLNNADSYKEEPRREAKFINPDIEEQKISEETIKEEANVTDDDFLDESFDNINNAISSFVSDYNNLKDEIKEKDKKIESLQSKIKLLTDENDRIVSNHEELKKANDKLKANNDDLKEENEKMNKRMKVLEDKLYKSAALLKRLYNGIKK